MSLFVWPQYLAEPQHVEGYSLTRQKFLSSLEMTSSSHSGTRPFLHGFSISVSSEKRTCNKSQFISLPHSHYPYLLKILYQKRRQIIPVFLFNKIFLVYCRPLINLRPGCGKDPRSDGISL